MNCIATAFKIPWIKRELFYMLKTFKKEIEIFAKVDTWSFPKWLDYLRIVLLHTYCTKYQYTALLQRSVKISAIIPFSQLTHTQFSALVFWQTATFVLCGPNMVVYICSSNWLLDHVIYLKLRKKSTVVKPEKIHISFCEICSP